MPRVPRISRPSRPILLTILVTALLAFPMGIVLANHQFSDVPNSNPFHTDIDALVDSGVTAGCGSGKYCPKSVVTREQMAAFLNRLGALAPGKTPVVNAAELGGLTSSAFHRYGSVAPSGSTMQGAFVIGGQAAAPGHAGKGHISFPVPLPSAPTSHVIPIGAAVPAGCAGSISDPRASAGHLCIFVGHAFNVPASLDVFSPLSGAPGTSRFGVLLLLFTPAAGSYTSSGSWAVTSAGGAVTGVAD